MTQRMCHTRIMSSMFLTIADVAERLQLSQQSVRTLIRTGELPAIQVGPRRLWRIPEEGFDAYIAAELERTRQRYSGDSPSTPGTDPQEI